MSISLNDSLQVNAPKAIDAKYMKFTGGFTQPYNNAAEAISTISSAFRYQYLTVLCIMNGDPIEYWWQSGTADVNLVTKSKESYTLNGTGSIPLVNSYLYTKIVIIPTTTISNLIIGTTVGGQDIEPGTQVIGTNSVVYNIGIYGASSTLYFGNLTTGTKILLYKEF